MCQTINDVDGLAVDCDLFDDGVSNASCADTLCDDGNPCTIDAYANGSCAHTPGNAGAVCRPSSGNCDPLETCDGVSASCPTDVTGPDICSDSCRDLIDDAPAATIDQPEETVCADTCLGLTNFTPDCGSCGGA